LPIVTRRRAVKMSRLPKGIRQAAARRVEQLQERSPVSDLLFVKQRALEKAERRQILIRALDEGSGPLGPRVQRYAEIFHVTARTVMRWLDRYRDNTEVPALVPRRRGPPLGQRRLSVGQETTVADVIDAWARRTERLPVSWIVE